MSRRLFFGSYRHDRARLRRRRYVVAGALLLVVGGIAAYAAGRGLTAPEIEAPVAVRNTPAVTPTPETKPRYLLGVESQRYYDAAGTKAVAAQNYGAATLPAKNGATKITFRYASQDLDGSPITVYGRAYIPDGALVRPIFAFAPGTTGIGDICAASLENPAVANWANYDSHMLMYASQGYASVTTDYEGMRDGSRLHHYMVGELEGRALLDAIRAMRELPEAKGKLSSGGVYLGGYSQGGHAAFWADSIAPTYARDVKVNGVVGFGPVMSVKDSIGQVVYGSTLNWFGPYVLVSYADYYKRNYAIDRILQPRYAANLSADVQSHCIDTDIAYWGRNPNAVYQPDFLNSINSPRFEADFPELAADLGRNAVPAAPTTSAKLINQGRNDNVVLARQVSAAVPGICAASRGPVEYREYPATHYSTMTQSLNDTLAWMSALEQGEQVRTTCIQ